MKKKIFSFVAIIIVLAVVLTGCNMFVVDAERDGDQVVASVTYEGVTANITKTEFLEYFNQNYPTYSYYYGYTAVECGDLFLSMMAKQEMLILKARVEFAKELGKDTNPKINWNNDSKGYDEYSNYLLSLLNPDEQKYVREQTNKMFEDSFDELVKKAVEQDKISNEDNKEDDEDTLKPRPVMPEEEDNEFKKDPSITQGDADAVKSFFEANKPQDPGPNATEEELKRYKFELDAYKDLEKNLEKQFRVYDYYLAQQAEARLVTKYQEKYGVYTDDIDVDLKYELTLAEQKALYEKSASDFKTAYEGATDPIIFHNGRYVKVKSILLKFTEEQEAFFNAVKSKFPNEDDKEYVEQIREALVFGNITEFEKLFNEMPLPIQEELEKGILVNISNEKYDETDPNSKPYEREDVPFLEVLAMIGKDIADTATKAESEWKEKYNKGNDPTTPEQIAGMNMYIAEKRIETFEKWIYKVNDDEGMFGDKEYVESPYEQDSDYVVEYTALVRQLLYDTNTAGGVMVNTDSSNSTVAGLKVTTAKVQGKEVKIYTDVTNNISFVINDFGVHIVMLTDVPFGTINDGKFTVSENTNMDYSKYEKYGDDELNKIKTETSYYTLGLDAYVDFDDETGKAITLREYLDKQLREQYENEVYQNHERDLFNWFGENVFDSSDDKEKGELSINASATMNKNVWNQILSDLKKIDKANEKQQ